MSIAEKLTTIAENEQKVYEAGQKSEYDRFWDDFQENGNRTNYLSAFGAMWTKETFKPKYPIRPTNAYFMFFNNVGNGILIEDFVEFCEENNVVLDYSQCTNAYYGIGCLFSKHFGVLDFSKCTNMNNLFYGHNSAPSGYSVETIDELISSETTKFHATAFQNAINLTNMSVSGVIANNGFDVSYCPKLTHDSLMSIINALKDYSGTGTTHTVTFGTTNTAKLTDTEKAIATQKGWTLA